MVCASAGITTERFSFAPLGLPGRLMIRDRPRMPATAREIMACGVTFMLEALMASAIPGISLSRTFSVASGVRSRGLTPVPPVVKIRSSLSTSAN